MKLSGGVATKVRYIEKGRALKVKLGKERRGSLMKPEREREREWGKSAVSSTKPGPKERGERFISGQTRGRRVAASLETIFKAQCGESGNIWEILVQL